MKKTTLQKTITIILSIVAILMVTALPAVAAETCSPQIQVNPNFDANSTIRTIFNWLVSIIALTGAAIGGWHIVMGQMNQDTKERNGGIVTLIMSLSVGGLMLLLLNMILL